jgi:uncharacterized protein YjlB
MEIKELLISPAKPFPNSARFPLLLYQSAVDRESVSPEWFENRFSAHGWSLSWRNGVYSYHHFHSSAHEVLGCYSGSARVLFGGPGGLIATLNTGDAVVIPAGVGHCLFESSDEFRVVGAYPDGTRPDTMEGRDAEYPEAQARSTAVPKPDSDPLDGADGPISRIWN